MLVVADSSALVALATCGALNMVTGLYDEIRVPQAVYEEVVVPEKPQAAVLSSFLTERPFLRESCLLLANRRGSRSWVLVGYFRTSGFYLLSTASTK